MSGREISIASRASRRGDSFRAKGRKNSLRASRSASRVYEYAATVAVYQVSIFSNPSSISYIVIDGVWANAGAAAWLEWGEGWQRSDEGSIVRFKA